MTAEAITAVYMKQFPGFMLGVVSGLVAGLGIGFGGTMYFKAVDGLSRKSLYDEAMGSCSTVTAYTEKDLTRANKSTLRVAQISTAELYMRPGWEIKLLGDDYVVIFLLPGTRLTNFNRLNILEIT